MIRTRRRRKQKRAVTYDDFAVWVLQETLKQLGDGKRYDGASTYTSPSHLLSIWRDEHYGCTLYIDGDLSRVADDDEIDDVLVALHKQGVVRRCRIRYKTRVYLPDGGPQSEKRPVGRYTIAMRSLAGIMLRYYHVTSKSCAFLPTYQARYRDSKLRTWKKRATAERFIVKRQQAGKFRDLDIVVVDLEETNE